MPTIRPTRQEISDRFSVLGFNIQTDGRRWFEVALATQPELFRDKGKRSPQNFFSSRAEGPLLAERGEAVYLVPPEVSRRFAGQPRLYYAVATFGDANYSDPRVPRIPGEESPWVSIKAFTGRVPRRMLLLGSGRGPASGDGDDYGVVKSSELTWAGDIAQPGLETAPPDGNGRRNGNGNGNGHGHGNGNAARTVMDKSDGAGESAIGAGFKYDDGFGPLPSEPAPAIEAEGGIEEPIPEETEMAAGPTPASALQQAAEYTQAADFIPARFFRTPGKPRAINRIVIHITDGSTGDPRATARYFQNPTRWLRVDVENGRPQIQSDSNGVCERFRYRGEWKDCERGRTRVQNGRTEAVGVVQVSAHYAVGQDGTVVQMVRHADVAFHAGRANSDSIGIEHNANPRNLPPSEAQYCASAALVRRLAEQFSIPMDRQHIVGHSEADPATSHTGCPNSVWDWNYFMGMVTSASCYPRPAAQGWQQGSTFARPARESIDSAELSFQARGPSDDGPCLSRPVQARAFSEEIPLDPGTGGMSISAEALQTGDIIVSTTREPVSKAIRSASGSPVSHAMIYIGEGQVIEAVAEGVVMRTLEEAVQSAVAAVAFRHPEITDTQQMAVRDFAKEQIGRRFDYWGVVKQARFRVNSAVCILLSGEARTRCQDFMGRVYLGSDSNDQFFCSELVLNAYQHAGIPLTDSLPHWSSPGEIADLRINGRLTYAGHLKAEPLSTGGALAHAGALGLAAMPADAVELLKNEFMANAQVGSPKSCIVITNAALRRAYGSALRDEQGNERKLGTTIQDTMAALESYGLAQSPTIVEFNDPSGQLTRGVTRPESLQSSIESWMKSEAEQSAQSGWYLFGLSLADGYHSVIIGLAFSGGNDASSRVFWADQIYSGWDDVTGQLDQRLAQLTQKWWDPLPQNKKFRTRVTVWPLLPPPASDTEALSHHGLLTTESDDGIEGYEEESALISQGLGDAECSDAFCPSNSRSDAGTENFTLEEFRCRDGAEAPERLRGNVQEVMNNLEVLRAELDKPIRITSGYRTCAYNSTLEGAASRSRHLCGQAADIQVTGHTPRQVHSTIERLISEGRMKEGGLGLYNTFVHYDVRGNRQRWDRRRGAAQGLQAIGQFPPNFSGVNRFSDAVRVFFNWLQRHLRFTAGVPDTTFFPFSAICKIYSTNAKGQNVGQGTGFYVGPRKVVTAGHVLSLADPAFTSRPFTAGGIRIIPGMNGGREPFGGLSAPISSATFHSAYNPKKYNRNADIAVITGAPDAPNGKYFTMEELRMSPKTGIIAGGYAADGDDVDPKQQNIDVDTIHALHNGTFGYRAQIRRGSSGGPVYYALDEQTIRVVGVNILASRRENTGLRLTDALIQWIQSV